MLFVEFVSFKRLWMEMQIYEDTDYFFHLESFF